MFGALWDFKGQKVTAETVMTRAGLNSDKPNDIFKLRARDKGKAAVRVPAPCLRNAREGSQGDGLYWMPCASPDFAAAWRPATPDRAANPEKSTHA